MIIDAVLDWIVAHRTRGGGRRFARERLARRVYLRLGWLVEDGERAWVAMWFASDWDRLRWGEGADAFDRSMAELEARIRAAGQEWPPTIRE